MKQVSVFHINGENITAFPMDEENCGQYNKAGVYYWKGDLKVVFDFPLIYSL